MELAVGDQSGQALDAGDVPHGLVAMAGQRGERTGIGERLEIAAVELRAVGEVGDVRERPLGARGDDATRPRFGETGDQAQAEAQRGAADAPGLRCIVRKSRVRPQKSRVKKSRVRLDFFLGKRASHTVASLPGKSRV